MMPDMAALQRARARLHCSEGEAAHGARAKLLPRVQTIYHLSNLKQRRRKSI